MSIAQDIIREQGVVAIVRTSTEAEADHIVQLLLKSNLRAIEVSLTTPGAWRVINRAVELAPVGVVIGVGTVLTVDDVSTAASVGAQFIVSPVVKRDLIDTALSAGLETLPGASTPTEALQAIEWGSTFVKIFPASMWSPIVLREVLSALPVIEAIPTGGVGLDTATEWIHAGAVAVGMGSALSKAAEPTEAARRLIDDIAMARRNRAAR